LNKLLPLLAFSILLLVPVGAQNAFADQANGLGMNFGTSNSVAVPQNGETLIDFEACTTGVSYSEDGALITATLAGFSVDCQSFGLTPDGSIGALGAINPNQQPFSPLRTDLGCTTSQVSMEIGDAGGDDDPIVVEAFTSGDVLVDTANVPHGPGVNGMETVTVTGANIAYVINSSPSGNPHSVFLDNIRFTCDAMVGGSMLPIDSTALMLAGLQSSAIWMLPVLAGIAGAGFYLVKFRTNKE